MMYKQTDIFEILEEEKNPKLNSIEHKILNTLKYRDLATEEIMYEFKMERVEVRKAIKRIRRYKTGHTMIMNTTIIYNNKKCNGYSTKGFDLLFVRWLSSTETLLNNNPFLLENCYAKLNEMKKILERPAEHQIKAQFTNYKPHDVTYRDYTKKEKK